MNPEGSLGPFCATAVTSFFVESAMVVEVVIVVLSCLGLLCSLKLCVLLRYRCVLGFKLTLLSATKSFFFFSRYVGRERTNMWGLNDRLSILFHCTERHGRAGPNK